MTRLPGQSPAHRRPPALSLSRCRAQDVSGAAATQNVSVTINLPPILGSLGQTQWTVSQTGYNQTPVASGGTGPLTFALVAGALPAGLSLNPATGAISGTPTKAGGVALTVQVQDTAGATADQTYTFTVNAAPTITTTFLATGTVNHAGYNQTIGVSGGTGAFAFSISSGALPGGLGLNAATGAITGTPTAAGLFFFTVKATDATGAMVSQDLFILVGSDTTTTTLTTSTSTAVVGQSVTFTAVVAGSGPAAGAPTGTITFKDGSTVLGTGTLASGSATFTTSSLAVAGHSITAVYGGDPNFTTSAAAALTQQVNQDGSIATVTSGLDPSVFGQNVTFTITVSAAAPGAGTPAGTVTVYDFSNSLGTATLSGGTATFSTTALIVGTHDITVQYGGNGNFLGSTSAILPQVVNLGTTSTGLTSSATPGVFSQSLTFTAKVTVSTGSGTPTGTVEFFDAANFLGTGSLSTADTATFTTSASTVGTHSIQAVYQGDTSFGGSSTTLSQTINQANSSISLAALSAAVYGQTVAFQATGSAAAPATAAPTGPVAFFDNGSLLGTGTLSSGVATFSTNGLSVGNHPITVSYGGDANFTSAGPTAAQTLSISRDSTVATIAGSVTPSVFGQAVSFTFSVTVNAPGAGTPTGTVTLSDNGTLLATLALTGGVAGYTTSTLAVGNHPLSISYNGDGNFTGSTGAFIQTVSTDAAANDAKLAELARPLSIDHFVQATGYAHWAFDQADGRLCSVDAYGLPPGVSDLKICNVSEAGLDAVHTIGRLTGALKFTGKMYATAAYPGISEDTPHTVLFWVKVPKDASVINSYAMIAWGVNNPELGSHPIQIGWNRSPGEGTVGALRTDYGGGYALGQTQLRDGAWHHIAVVFVPRSNDPRGPIDVKEYVDGRLEAEGKRSQSGSDIFVYSSENTPQDTLGNFWLGCRVGVKGVRADRFSGEIDDLFIVDRALEPQEIMRVMSSNQM